MWFVQFSYNESKVKVQIKCLIFSLPNAEYCYGEYHKVETSELIQVIFCTLVVVTSAHTTFVGLHQFVPKKYAMVIQT